MHQMTVAKLVQKETINRERRDENNTISNERKNEQNIKAGIECAATF